MDDFCDAAVELVRRLGFTATDEEVLARYFDGQPPTEQRVGTGDLIGALVSGIDSSFDYIHQPTEEAIDEPFVERDLAPLERAIDPVVWGFNRCQLIAKMTVVRRGSPIRRLRRRQQPRVDGLRVVEAFGGGRNHDRDEAAPGLVVPHVVGLGADD